MSGKPLSVGVVLVNWNGGEFTTPCITSLLAGFRKPDVIVVVDNASSDGSLEAIMAAFPEVVVVRNDSNRGFAAATNQGTELLLKAGMSHIWSLNNDTLVAADCLDRLFMIASQHPAVAGFSAKIFYDPPRESAWYAGASRHPLHRAPKHIATHQLDEAAVNGIVYVPFISGCCMFVPAWALRQLGGFINSYVAYSEDSEWCWRVEKAGYKLGYVPNAHIWHRVSASVKKNLPGDTKAAIRPDAYYLMVRNHLWTVRRHARREGIPLWLVLFSNLLIHLKNACKWALSGQMGLVKASAKGTYEGLHANVPCDIPHWK